MIFNKLYSYRKVIVPLFGVIAFLTLLTPSVRAVNSNDILDQVKGVFKKETPKELVINSNISLAPSGDANNNNAIDAGDIVRFTYTITNTTDKNYSYVTLNTNINRNDLNFIHSLRGATGLSDTDGKIKLRNIRINSNEQRVLSFDARINYSREDKDISTEPEFITEDQKLILKSDKKSVSAKKLSDEEVKKRLENRGVVLKEIKK